jgi:transcriptional regulator with XRE-family HTH domain
MNRGHQNFGDILAHNVSYDLMDEQMTDHDKDFYIQLGDRVANLRKEQGLTQVQLAKILGISQQLMAAYEAAQRKIPAVMIPKLAGLFEVSCEELLGTKQPAAKRGPTPVLQRQVEQIRLLPRTKQKFVMDMLDTVIKQQG